VSLMVPARTVIVCPHCRVFTDRLSLAIFSVFTLRCPWCAELASIARYVEAAERETCPVCEHPTCAHVAWWTPDGSPPHPLTRAAAVPTAAPCVFCAAEGRPDCRAQDGAREVAT
jgi:hypothetical protein